MNHEPGTRDRLVNAWFTLSNGSQIRVGPVRDSDSPYTFGRARAYVAAQYTERGVAKLLVLKARFGERGPMDSFDLADS